LTCVPTTSGNAAISLVFASSCWLSASAVISCLISRLPAPANLAFHVIFMTFAATGILSARESYHKFAVIIVSGIFVAYVVMLFSFAMNELAC
jgi:hypothetical protein